MAKQRAKGLDLDFSGFNAAANKIAQTGQIEAQGALNRHNLIVGLGQKVGDYRNKQKSDAESKRRFEAELSLRQMQHRDLQQDRLANRGLRTLEAKGSMLDDIERGIRQQMEVLGSSGDPAARADLERLNANLGKVHQTRVGLLGSVGMDVQNFAPGAPDPMDAKRKMGSIPSAPPKEQVMSLIEVESKLRSMPPRPPASQPGARLSWDLNKAHLMNMQAGLKSTMMASKRKAAKDQVRAIFSDSPGDHKQYIDSALKRIDLAEDTMIESIVDDASQKADASRRAHVTLMNKQRDLITNMSEKAAGFRKSRNDLREKRMREAQEQTSKLRRLTSVATSDKAKEEKADAEKAEVKKKKMMSDAAKEFENAVGTLWEKRTEIPMNGEVDGQDVSAEDREIVVRKAFNNWSFIYGGIVGDEERRDVLNKMRERAGLPAARF